jgi:D-3-phosphoglycerate dehydrogenase
VAIDTPAVISPPQAINRSATRVLPLVSAISPSFSQNSILRDELRQLFPQARFNEAGIRLSGTALAEYVGEADAIVVGLERVDRTLLKACPRLKIISKYGVGLDNIDLEACGDSGVAVGWTGGVNRRSVAELVLCLALGLCRNVFHVSTLLREGEWEKKGGTQLSGKTVGIIGLGYVGREVADLLTPFHCRILANDILPINDYCREHGIVPADKETLYAESDLITLHVPFTPATHRLIDRVALTRMKKGSMLINTARGEIVDASDLKWALQNGVIAAAAIDVFAEEPPSDSEFLHLPNLVATAHIGGASHEAILATGRSAIRHLQTFFERNPTAS